MEKELEADSLFQVLLRIFYVLFGIERKSQIKTELKEILAKSVRIDAVVSFPDNFDFTNLLTKIFPWLGKHNVMEYKGPHDPLKVGQYVQYALVELGLLLTRMLSKECVGQVGCGKRDADCKKKHQNIDTFRPRNNHTTYLTFCPILSGRSEFLH